MSSIIIKRAEEISIKTSEDLTSAVEILSSLNKIKDEIEAEKVKVTRPLLDALNAERSRWKPRELQLETVTVRLRSMISVFQTALVTKQRLEEEAIAKRLSDGKILPTTAIKRMDAITTAPTNVKTDKGQVSFKTVRKFEVVDFRKVPVEYLLLNETAIRESLREGKEVEGVRYWDEQSVINYR